MADGEPNQSSFASGFFGTIGDALQKKLDQQQANQQELKKQQAQVYIDAIKSGRLSPDQIAYAQQQLQKLYGGGGGEGGKFIKNLLGKFGQIASFGHHAAGQAQGGGATPGEAQTPTPPVASSPSAMPQPGGGGAGPSMSEQTPIGGSSVNPPGTPAPAMSAPPSFASIASAANPNPVTEAGDIAFAQGEGKNRAEMQAITQRKQVAQELGLKPGSNEYYEYIATGKWPTAARIQRSQMVDKRSGAPLNFDPDTGSYMTQDGLAVPPDQVASAVDVRPKPIQYQGPNGEALPGNYVNGKYLDRDGKELPEGTVIFHPSLAGTTTETTTVKIVRNAQGGYDEVPVTSSSVRTRQGGSSAIAPPPAKPSAARRGSGAKASAGSARPVTDASGKPIMAPVATEVKKAYDAYNSAVERYAVMQDALPRAMKGDQQAMVNLLANHIGMTMGLQPRARITQAIYSEARESAPWLQRVRARWNPSTGYLTGVVLTPEQMKQMIDLAQVRLAQDKAAYEREVSAAKGGYGMGQGDDSASPAPAMTPPPGPPPKTADQYLQSIGAGGAH